MSDACHYLPMDDIRAGRALRRLRSQRRLTQSTLAALAGVSQSSVSLVERGHLDRLALRTLRRLFAAVEATYEGVVRWRGGALDRLLDERHAFLVETVVRQLEAARWDVAVEASFNHFGDRGSIDVLALHRPSRHAVVVEVKSELTDIEETLRRLDVKARLAGRIVADQFGMAPIAVGRLLVLPRSATAWRRVRRLEATFAAALPAGSLAARQWLRLPAGQFAGRMFVSSSDGRGARSTARGGIGSPPARSSVGQRVSPGRPVSPVAVVGR